MSDRKAQVTVFMIIGLVLLVSASIVIYLTTIRKVEVIEEIVVPPEVKPIYDYVANCLYETGSDALVLIGTQGGYADLSPERIDTRDITMTPSAYIKIDPSNTFKLPHWFYDGENRTPPIEFIQKELADYVSKNLGSCINNFTAFAPQFEITELGRPIISSIFTDKDVVVRLTYPIEIRQADKTTEHSEFMTRVPIRLRKMWELAKAIMEKENELNIFESLTIDLMAMSENVPMDDFKLKCGVMTWKLDDVKEEAQRLIRYNIPRMRVKGTDYPPFLASEEVYEELKTYTMEDINEGRLPDIATPSDAFEYNRMMVDPGIAGAEDMKVSFIYLPRWGMDLNALPNEAGMLKSNLAPGQSFLSFLCINTYHFTYDVIYPVQVRIQDPEAYAGRGYVFQFAFPVLIDDNQPNREGFGARLFQDYYIDTTFCEQPGGPTVEIRVIGLDEMGYMMTSGLKDVNISYRCFNKRCQLGQTGYSPAAPGRYSLIVSLPPGCKNPIIGVEKEGYLGPEKQMTGDTLEIEMIKLRKMPFTALKHPSFRGEAIGAATELTKGDEISAYIQLRGRPVRHEQYFVYSYGQNETEYVELVDGQAQYDMDVMLHNYDRFVGGYRAKNITISYDDFAGYDEMVFHVFDYRPRPIKDADVMAMIAYYMGEEYKNELRPTFR